MSSDKALVPCGDGDFEESYVLRSFGEFAEHPKHPDIIVSIYPVWFIASVKRLSLLALLVCTLCIGALNFGFGADEFIIPVFLLSVVLGIIPRFLTYANMYKVQRQRARCQIVWDLQPQDAMERLRAYQLDHTARAHERKLLKRKSARKFVASLVLSLTVFMVYSPIIAAAEFAKVWIASTFNFGSLGNSMFALFEILLTVSVGFGLMWLILTLFFSSLTTRLNIHAIERERKALKSISPELFSEEMLHGALSFEEDSTQGALTQAHWDDERSTPAADVEASGRSLRPSFGV